MQNKCPVAELAAPGDLTVNRQLLADNPYPFYDQLRDHAAPNYDPLLDAWWVSRHNDVVAALRHPLLTTRPNAGFLEILPSGEFITLRTFFETWLSFSDPPNHTDHRAALTHTLSLRAMPQIRPIVTQIANRLADKAALVGGCDVIADFGRLPVLALARVIGLSHEDLLSCGPWIDDIGQFMVSPTESTAIAAQNSIDQWRDWFEARSSSDSAAGTLIGDLWNPRCGVTPPAALALIASLLTGPPSRRRGENEPTAQFLAKALNILICEDSTLRLLRESPGLVPAAVEELLRLDPPFHYVSRHASAPVTIGGCRIATGQRVIVLLASANRDPAAFARPDEIVLDRADGRHVAFGFGAHFCLGAPLARLEIEAMLTAIVSKLGPLRRTRKPQWRMEGGFRALDELSLACDDDLGALLKHTAVQSNSRDAGDPTHYGLGTQ